MASNILESITAQYHSLTRSGKKLADYIFAHTGEAQYFSISTLAENSGVSEASITRFCHGLGLADTMISNWRWQKQTMSQIWGNFLILPRELLPKTV